MFSGMTIVTSITNRLVLHAVGIKDHTHRNFHSILNDSFILNLRNFHCYRISKYCAPLSAPLSKNRQDMPLSDDTW